MKLLLVDNYDSFTHNLKEVFVNQGAEIVVKRNDQIDLSTLEEYDGIVLSPGPGVPDTAGDLKLIIESTYRTKPILGICLGMQAIAEVLSSELDLMEVPLHGTETALVHFNHSCFENVPSPFNAGRYHSWQVNEASLSNQLEVIARDEKGTIMGIQMKDFPVIGLQFHPESIMTAFGSVIINNFLKQISKNEIIIE